jgi:hypothetical protein
MRNRLFPTVWLGVLLLVLMLGTSWACEGCANLEATSTGQSVKAVQAGFSWSVLFLLGVPMALMAWLLRLMVKACQAVDAKHQLKK